jgi:hypothetical protein
MYKLTCNVYLDGEVKAAGSVVQLDAESAKPLLERGSIVLDGQEAPGAEVTPEVAPLEEVEAPATPLVTESVTASSTESVVSEAAEAVNPQEPQLVEVKLS